MGGLLILFHVNEGGLAMEVMDCNRLVVTWDMRMGIVGMVGIVDELWGDWGMDSDIVWDEGLGGGVSGEDVEKWVVVVQVQGSDY